jgi:K+-sensing histidine kinase KdpD
MAIRQAAQALDSRKVAEVGELEPKTQRILVNVTSQPSTAMLLRRARRVADFLHADCVAVYVHSSPEFSDLLVNERQAIERHLRFAEGLHIDTRVIQGKKRERALVHYAHENGFTRILISPAPGPPRRWFPGLDFTDQVLQLAHDLEVTVVAERTRDGQVPLAYPEDEAGGLMHSGFVSLSAEMLWRRRSQKFVTRPAVSR